MGNYNKPTPYYAYTYRDKYPITEAGHFTIAAYRSKNYYEWSGYDNNAQYDCIDYVSEDVIQSSIYRLVDIVKKAQRNDFNTEIIYQ